MEMSRRYFFLEVAGIGSEKRNEFHAILGDFVKFFRNKIDFTVLAGNYFNKKGFKGCEDRKWNAVCYESFSVDYLNAPWLTCWV